MLDALFVDIFTDVVEDERGAVVHQRIEGVGVKTESYYIFPLETFVMVGPEEVSP